MMDSTRIALALGAAALTIQPVAASAQQTCIAEEEVSALVIFFVPTLIDTVQERCVDHLATDGFLARRADGLAARYAALRETVWPLAKSAMIKLAGQETKRDRREAAELANHSDEVLQPLMEEMLAMKFAEDFKTRDCGRIERVMEAMAPIEPTTTGNLIGVIVGLVDLDDPPVCPVPRT